MTFVVLKVTLGLHLRMKAECPENQPSDVRAGIFNPIPLTSGEDRGAGDGVNHQWPVI